MRTIKNMMKFPTKPFFQKATYISRSLNRQRIPIGHGFYTRLAIWGRGTDAFMTGLWVASPFTSRTLALASFDFELIDLILLFVN